MRNQRLTRCVTAVLLVTSLSACSSSTKGTAAPSEGARTKTIDGLANGAKTYQTPTDNGLQAVFDELRSRREKQESYQNLPARTLADLLPNQLFTIFGTHGGPRPLAGGVVIRKVTSTRPGIGYYLKHRDSDGGTATTYGDPRAKWHTGIFTVQVDRSWGLAGSPSKIDASIEIDAKDPDAYLASIKSLGTTLIILDPTGGPRRDSATYQVMSDEMLADVDANGRINFPAIGAGNRNFLQGVDTVSEVTTEAAKTRPVLKAVVIRGSLDYPAN